MRHTLRAGLGLTHELSTKGATLNLRNRITFRRIAAAASTLLLATALGASSVAPASAKTQLKGAVAKAQVSALVLKVRQPLTPFIATITIGRVPTSKATKVGFAIAPKPGTVSDTIRGSYSFNYLKSRGLLHPERGTIEVPVYGLYENYANTVQLLLSGPNFSQTLSAKIATAPWVAAGNPQFTAPQRVVDRRPNIKLGYSFFMLKTWSAGAHPVVIDTDGNVRWVGTADNGQQGSTFVNGNFYLGIRSKLMRIGLDGSVAEVNDLESQGYNTYHHQIDPGRNGLLLELNHNSDTESNIVEVSLSGKVLREFDLAKIVSDTMVAAGDDPSAFVRSGRNDDWFHNNAAAYWPDRNELVVSSRENFVMGIDYDTQQIKWILGDPAKKWHQYPSLAALALTVPAGSHYPIGQHAVSITSDGKLMLFDNGYASMNQSPAGDSRNFSAPRQYVINEIGRLAIETWQFNHSPDIFSPICSSIYQSNGSYLIDYASENWGDMRLVGLDANKNIAFEYLYAGANWSRGWNALPVHVENLSFK